MLKCKGSCFGRNDFAKEVRSAVVPLDLPEAARLASPVFRGIFCFCSTQQPLNINPPGVVGPAHESSPIHIHSVSEDHQESWENFTGAVTDQEPRQTGELVFRLRYDLDDELFGNELT
jgi:hypothetical protein